MATKRQTEITHTRGNPGIMTMPEMPEFMQQSGAVGTEQLSQYITPPRLKIVQAQSSDELKSQFGDGTAIITPDLVPIVIWERNPKTGQVVGGGPGGLFGPSFEIVPIFFYPEFVHWNPYQAMGSAPAIIERTTDKNSHIAQRARSGNRTDPYPGNANWVTSYVEHLNFMCRIFVNGEPLEKSIVISFARGEHKAGRDFAALIKMRKAPIFGCRFKATIVKRIKDDYNWFGCDISNPDSGSSPWIIDADQYLAYELLHKDLTEAYESAKLRVDYEVDVETTVPDTMTVDM